MYKLNEPATRYQPKRILARSAATEPKRPEPARSSWMFWINVGLHALFLIVMMIVWLRSS